MMKRAILKTDKEIRPGVYVSAGADVEILSINTLAGVGTRYVCRVIGDEDLFQTKAEDISVQPHRPPAEDRMRSCFLR